MPSNALITFIPGTLPANYCYTTPQQYYIDIMSITQGFLPGQYTTVIKSATAPDSTDRDKVWFRLNNDNSFDRAYVFFNGIWVSKHPLPIGFTSIAPRSLGNAVAVGNWDEGVGADPTTALTGPFWEVDTDFSGRSPIGAGALGGGTTLVTGDNFGEERHTQLAGEVGVHTHLATIQFNNTSGGWSQVVIGSSDTAPNTSYPVNVSNNVGGTPFNVVHPVHTRLFIKRTSRIFYTAS